MRKKIQLSKLSVRSLMMLISGISLSTIGLVLSIIIFASNLYTNIEEYPFDISNNQDQILCNNCNFDVNHTIWLKTINRKIEYTDNELTIQFRAEDGRLLFKDQTSFVLISLRNQTGGSVYYKLADCQTFANIGGTLFINKSGEDILEQPASIIVREFREFRYSLWYIAMIVLGTALTIVALRLPPRPIV